MYHFEYNLTLLYSVQIEDPSFNVVLLIVLCQTVLLVSIPFTIVIKCFRNFYHKKGYGWWKDFPLLWLHSNLTQKIGHTYLKSSHRIYIQLVYRYPCWRSWFFFYSFVFTLSCLLSCSVSHYTWQKWERVMVDQNHTGKRVLLLLASGSLNFITH